MTTSEQDGNLHNPPQQDYKGFGPEPASIAIELGKIYRPFEHFTALPNPTQALRDEEATAFIFLTIPISLSGVSGTLAAFIDTQIVSPYEDSYDPEELPVRLTPSFAFSSAEELASLYDEMSKYFMTVRMGQKFFVTDLIDRDFMSAFGGPRSPTYSYTYMDSAGEDLDSVAATTLPYDLHQLKGVEVSFITREEFGDQVEKQLENIVLSEEPESLLEELINTAVRISKAEL